jgi:hypothetical protein
MNEGWCNGDYLVLFSEEESHAKTQQYNLPASLPGYRVVGLKGWDDFIVVAPTGTFFSVPTVPANERYLQAFNFPSPLVLDADERFLGKVKWYTKPIIFGGDPNAGDNLTWVDHEQHAQLVNWWNEQYRGIASTPGI